MSSAQPPQRLARLLDALDTLVAQESVALEAREWEPLAQVQARLADLANAIAPIAEEMSLQGTMPQDLKERASNILKRQQSTLDRLHENLALVKVERNAASAVRARINLLRPAYAGSPKRNPSSSAFNGHG